MHIAQQQTLQPTKEQVQPLSQVQVLQIIKWPHNFGDR